MTYFIRDLTERDFDDAVGLYRELVGTIPVSEGTSGRARFADILSHPGTTVLGCERGGRILSMATLHILPNMTFAGRPYALIENVVTFASCRGTGMGAAVMRTAIARAWAKDAYKVMLLTGRDLGAAGFYEKLGFSMDEKHGMTLRRAPKRQPLA